MRSLHTATKSSPRLPQLEKAQPVCSNEDPTQPKINKINTFKKKKKRERLEKNTFKKKLKKGWAEDLDFHYFFAILTYLTFHMRNVIFIIRKMIFNLMNTL